MIVIMENKKPIKISFNKLMFFIVLVICFIAIVIGFIINNAKNDINNIDYQKIICKDIPNSSMFDTINYKIISNYEEYKKIIQEFNDILIQSKSNNYVSGINTKFAENIFDTKNLLVIDIYDWGSPNFDTDIFSLKERTHSVDIKITEESHGVTDNTNEHIYIIPVSKNITTAKIQYPYQNPINLNNIIAIVVRIMALFIFIIIIIGIIKTKKKKFKMALAVYFLILIFGILAYTYNVATQKTIAYKPIIYLYPKEETEITLKLKNNENITCSYPEYTISGWNVIAKPNGDLINLSNGRSLYSLYYESTNKVNFEMKDDGFIISRNNVTKFLEEKLNLLGLTERESEEFILYWLPKLQENKYNYIRFATIDEINKNMPLEFSVKPDTLIRVLMTYKGLDKPINIEEQKLETPERTGFVAIEWGGTEIK